jgi:HEPN domain-containing protein
MAISRDVGLGRAFWRQSLADAEESRLLLSHGRIAAALVSCQHAIEKALKAALCVEVGEHSFQLRHNISLELWKSQKLKLWYLQLPKTLNKH